MEELKALTLSATADLRVTRVKHRLAPSFDASDAGGYRDVLCNVRLAAAPSLICEVQINTQEFVDIKGTGGGHDVYKAARKLHAFDDTSTACVSLATSNSFLFSSSLLLSPPLSCLVLLPAPS